MAVEYEPRYILNLGTKEGCRLNSDRGYFNNRLRYLSTLAVGSWGSSSAWLESLKERKPFATAWNQTRILQSNNTYPSHNTDWTILVPYANYFITTQRMLFLVVTLVTITLISVIISVAVRIFGRSSCYVKSVKNYRYSILDPQIFLQFFWIEQRLKGDSYVFIQSISTQQNSS